MFNTTRPLSQYLRTGNQPDLFLVDINHPAGAVYLHSGIGIFEHNGNTYYGTGGLGSIELGGNQSEIAETQVKFNLSGIDATTVAMLDTKVKPGTGAVTRVWLNEHWKVAHEVVIEECLLEKMDLTVSDGQATITLYGKGGFHEIHSRSSAMWDPQNQRQRLTALGLDPDSDTGFDQMHLMRDKLIVSAAE